MVKRLGEKNWYRLRFEVLRRDNFTCRYCGQSAPNVKLEVDHVLELADGGTNDPDNLVTSCYACNRGKSGTWLYNKRRKWQQSDSSAPPLNHNQTIGSLALAILQNGPKTPEEIQVTLNCKMDSLRKALTRLRTAGKVKNLPDYRWGLKS